MVIVHLERLRVGSAHAAYTLRVRACSRNHVAAVILQEAAKALNLLAHGLRGDDPIRERTLVVLEVNVHAVVLQEILEACRRCLFGIVVSLSWLSVTSSTPTAETTLAAVVVA